MKVKNQKTIRRLSFRIFGANRTRNLVAVLAIALTAMMFTALFTIAVTLNHSSEQQMMRQVGGYSHGGFKRLTEEQVDDLRDDPLIRESGATYLFSVPEEDAFLKISAEMRYAEDNYAKFCWSLPTSGAMPKQGKEIAMDTAVLELLGIPAKLGEEVELTYPLGNTLVTDTFTLCGYWEADPALPAHMIWLSKEYALSQMEQASPEEREQNNVGDWYLDLVFEDSRDISGTLEKIAENHGYTIGEATEGTELACGINWAYTSTHSESMDAQSIFPLIGAVIVMLLTGYLIIYNVFQISVAGDVRFYGLLKTIGTTGRQIRRIVRWQALLLSGIGIPIGLIFGYLTGNLLMPVIMANLDDATVYRSANPVIFIGAALFALVTVFISCFLPARRAAKVSPVEAVRYTEQSRTKKKKKKSRNRNRLFQMAWANLMRNKLKTILVVLSLALSIVMLNGVYGFTRGFSMDGFLEKFVISDFLVADADYFKYSGWEEVSPSLVESLKHLDGFEDGGYVGYFQDYRQLQVTKKSYVDWMTNRFNQFSLDELDPELLALPDDAMTEMHLAMYVLDDYTVSKLEVIEGSLEGWKEPGNIVQVILTDDYGNPIMDQAMYEVGDQVEIISSTDYTVSEDGLDVTRNSQLEESYTVIATAVIPNVMTTRGHGYPEFAVSGESIPKGYEAFVTDMVYLADFTEEGTAAAEQFVQDYTEKIEPEMAYESKGKYAGNYEQFQMMFWMVGGSLSFIIGLVGLLNFINGEVTSILSRKRELAMLQSIGMTGRQMKRMLVLEGILTSGGALILAAVLNLGVYFGMMPVIEDLFWFFQKNFTMTMILAAVLVLLAAGILIPLLVYKRAEKKSIVERLRESEN